MRYELWGHISKNEWEAFGAKKATPNEVVSILLYYSFWFNFTSFDSIIKLIYDIWFLLINQEKRGKAFESTSKRKFYHRLGLKTYDEVQKEWVDTGLYPNQSPMTSSTATYTSVNTPCNTPEFPTP